MCALVEVELVCSEFDDEAIGGNVVQTLQCFTATVMQLLCSTYEISIRSSDCNII